MGVNIDEAFDAILPHIGPTVPAHPFTLAPGALVLTKTTLLALVGSQTFTFGSGLKRYFPNFLDFTWDIAIGAAGLGFNSQAGKIEHSVANCSPSLQRFFGAALPRR